MVACWIFQQEVGEGSDELDPKGKLMPFEVPYVSVLVGWGSRK